MIVNLGRRGATEQVVDLLLECHHRIRRFLAMARALAAAPDDTPAAEVSDTAAQVRRYFVSALPLHIADEEVDLAPLLAGRDADVDHALATMHDDHADHAAMIARLIELTGAIAEDAGARRARAAELAAVAGALEVQLAIHLALEERVLFPAVRALSGAEQDGLRAAIRERRARVFADSV